MKKILLLIASFILVFNLAACGASGGGSSSATTTTVATNTTTSSTASNNNTTTTSTTNSSTTSSTQVYGLVSQSPNDGGNNIICSPKISAFFDADLKQSSVNSSSFQLSTSGSSIEGTITFSSRAITFEPTSLLAINTTYEVSLSGLQTSNGSSLSNHTWNFTTGRTLRSWTKGESHFYHNPATLKGEYLYVGTDNTLLTTHNCYMFKFDKNLNKVWEYPLGTNPVAGAPVLDGGGNLYFVYAKNSGSGAKPYLMSLTNDGNLRWEYQLTGDVAGFGLMTPAISSDEAFVYAGGSGLRAGFSAFSTSSQSGTPTWTYSSAGGMAPIIDNQGKIYFAGKDPQDYERIYCLTSSGSLEWQSDRLTFEATMSGPELVNSPCFNKDYSRIYMTNGAVLNCVNTTTGTVEWSYQVDLVSGDDIRIRNTPVVDESGNVFFGTKSNSNVNGSLYGLNSDGTLKWHNTSNTYDHYSSPAIGNDGNLYFGTEGSIFEVVDKATGNYVWKTMLPENTGGDITWSSPVIDSNGVLYVGTIWGTNSSGEAATGGYFLSIQSDCSGLQQNCGSPKYRGGNANTGRRYDQ